MCLGHDFGIRTKEILPEFCVVSKLIDYELKVKVRGQEMLSSAI